MKANSLGARLTLTAAVTLAAISATALLGGCGGGGSGRPLSPDAFRTTSPDAPVGPVDRGGPAVVLPPTPQQQAQTPAAGEEPVRTIQPAIKEAVKSPEEVATQPVPPSVLLAPTTIPTTTPATGATTGQYMTLGAVVAEVNGTPIYANKVLAVLSKALQANAQEMDEREFRIAATNLLKNQIREFIRNELEFATAQRLLDPDDKLLAEQLATQYRQHLITEAGGSVELARRRAQAQGLTLEEQVQDEYRTLMTQVFYQKRVWPRVQVSADDMRRYYDRNVDSQFTEHAQAQFRLIKIDPRKMGGIEEARAKAVELQERAARGEDFAELAGSINHDERLMKARGDQGWIQRGAFKLEKVEQAVWAIQPGDVTPVIEEGGAFYVAKLEQRKKGRVAPFEEEAVQNAIRRTLRMEQFQAMREKFQQSLIENAIIRGNPEDPDPARRQDSLKLMAPALEMAMQEYARWSRR